ncbi:uncharacterized protein ARMOST_07173 [Armillaria ostoyae]|uniref:BAG domain-containing protein n=1 Tax=Armillaria ostoyae TaxID=47428 RepID=A0A284R524_ARMOS|nr:uncharacterized protein ARMOST_07173 [Armillaria ostoyae]
MVNVKWNKEKFSFNVPLETKLADFRQIVAEETHLDAFKLIYKGAIMKDDKAPLSAYHLKQSSSITLLPLHDTLPTSSSIQNTEQTSLSNIQQELASIRQGLIPSLNTFLDALPQKQPSMSALEKEHARLGELLLQSLLRLDAISTDGEWEDARRERKAAVKEVQALLDQLDDAWSAR